MGSAGLKLCMHNADTHECMGGETDEHTKCTLACNKGAGERTFIVPCGDIRLRTQAALQSLLRVKTKAPRTVHEKHLMHSFDTALDSCFTLKSISEHGRHKTNVG